MRMRHAQVQSNEQLRMHTVQYLLCFHSRSFLPSFSVLSPDYSTSFLLYSFHIFRWTMDSYFEFRSDQYDARLHETLSVDLNYLCEPTMQTIYETTRIITYCLN